MSDTLAGPVSHLVEIKHSRFLAQGVPVTTSEAALAALTVASDPAATHNCWAYRIGGEYRSSDDGEPSGTAGRPILAAIDAQGFDQVAVVVTRWYGGVKLGAGGLARAYGGAAAECLRLAPRRALVELCDLSLQCAFDDLGHVHAAIETNAAEKLEETFSASGVRIGLRLPAQRADALKIQLRDATRNRVRFLPRRDE